MNRLNDEDIAAKSRTGNDKDFSAFPENGKTPNLTAASIRSGKSAADWLEYADAMLRQGATRDARNALESALRDFPAHVELLCGFANAERLLGNGAAAEAILLHLLQLQPEHLQARLTLAFIYRDRGRISAATQLIRTLERPAGDPARSLYLSELLEECRRTQDAADICEAALTAHPNRPALQFKAGHLSLSLGQFDRARTRLLAALDHPAPEWGALLPLALSQRYLRSDDPDLLRFRSAFNDRHLSAGLRAIAGFALGKALDDVGELEQASTVLREANAIERDPKKWQLEQWRLFVDSCIESQQPVDRRALTLDTRAAPIFIVGLPRTGTTLLAELLARRPLVRNRGELNWIEFIARRFTSGGRSLGSIDASELRAAAGLYLAQLRQDDAPADWYVDKNPLNFRRLDLICRLFPNARIIHCTRGRRDTALSIWSQSMDNPEMAWSNHWDDIAGFAEGHDRLMDHWQKILPVKIHRVAYETLASSTAEVIHDLGTQLGLSDFDTSGAKTMGSPAVNTASVWQVRQPVYTRSIGRWRAYAPWLPELLQFAE